jgi:murein DD-endopeptidase MepM/ murein hydrolase activator NlpD
MQLILITKSGRNFLSLKLAGWVLALAILLIGALVITAVWAGIAFGSFQGSLTDRLMHIWQVSRSDTVASEIGALKAKIEYLENTMRTIHDVSERSNELRSFKRQSHKENSKTDELQELQARAQKISFELDGYSQGLQSAVVNRTSSSLLMPVENAAMSSRYGWRQDPLTGDRAFHSGVDWSSPVGTPVFSVGNGVVVFIGPASKLGNMVEIRHGENIVARYAHLQGIEVISGMPVVAGQRIARVGSTGRSTGSHLHFEIIVDGNKVNPENFLPKDKTRTTKNKDLPSCCALASTL